GRGRRGRPVSAGGHRCPPAGSARSAGSTADAGRTSRTAWRHMKRRRRLRDRLALPAREFLAHRLDYLPLAWDHLQRLGDVLPSFAGFLDPAEARTYSRKSSFVMPLVAPFGSPVRTPFKNPMPFSPPLAPSSPATSSPTSPATFSPSLPSTPAASALKLLLGSCLSFTSVVFTCFLVSSSTI